MSSLVSTEQRDQFAGIIDDILQVSDLSVISEKKIRKGLEEKLGFDVNYMKPAVKTLIMERFDKFQPAAPSAAPEPETPKPVTNGHTIHNVKRESKSRSLSEPQTEDDESDVRATPPKKKRKQESESDAKLAKRLQAEENSRTRPTRGSATKKSAPMKKKRTPKKKSAAKIKADDDSDLDLDSNGEKKEVVRKGGFHKQYALSHQLADLVGESQLSRPQVVKKIWEYIKERDLQDPSDKRQILCDERMQLVFKTDKVHMFTMNKILGKQLYPIENEE